MKRPLPRVGLAAAAMLAMAMPGCATLQPTRPPLAATLADERALAALELAFQAAVAAAILAIDAGTVQPGTPAAAALAEKLDRAHALLVKARAAQAAGQNQAAADLAAQALIIIGEVRP